MSLQKASKLRTNVAKTSVYSSYNYFDISVLSWIPLSYLRHNYFDI
jgi:hypothetical protein